MLLESALREFAAWLVENPSCRFTATKLPKPLGVASTSTLTQWCDRREKTYLFFFVPRHSAATNRTGGKGTRKTRRPRSISWPPWMAACSPSR